MMLDAATGLRRKILIFTEPKDTLEYLAHKIIARFGDAAAVVVIHGGIAREARRGAIAAFNSDPVVRVMIANDAAGEGVNLQRGAHLMVNYDLPWNPNRLEQRFGRIHRIGQTGGVSPNRRKFRQPESGPGAPSARGDFPYFRSNTER
jgi:superfamily II DNA/RNA helicase